MQDHAAIVSSDDVANDLGWRLIIPVAAALTLLSCGSTPGLRQSYLQTDPRVARVDRTLRGQGLVPDYGVHDQPIMIDSRLVFGIRGQVHPNSYTAIVRRPFRYDGSTISFENFGDGVADCFVAVVLPDARGAVFVDPVPERATNSFMVGHWTPAAPWVGFCSEERYEPSTHSFAVNDGISAVSFTLLLYRSSSAPLTGSAWADASIEPPLWDADVETVPDAVESLLVRRAATLEREGWRPGVHGWQSRSAARATELVVFDSRERAYEAQDYGEFGQCWAFLVAARGGALDVGFPLEYNDHRLSRVTVGEFTVTELCVCGDRGRTLSRLPERDIAVTQAVGPVRFRAWSINSRAQQERRRSGMFCGEPYATVTRGDYEEAARLEDRQRAEYSAREAERESEERAARVRRARRESEREDRERADAAADEARRRALVDGIGGAVRQFGEGVNDIARERQAQMDRARELREQDERRREREADREAAARRADAQERADARADAERRAEAAEIRRREEERQEGARAEADRARSEARQATPPVVGECQGSALPYYIQVYEADLAVLRQERETNGSGLSGESREAYLRSARARMAAHPQAYDGSVVRAAERISRWTQSNDATCEGSMGSLGDVEAVRGYADGGMFATYDAAIQTLGAAVRYLRALERQRSCECTVSMSARTTQAE